MEVRRTINNGSCLFCIGTVVTSALLGYFLLVGVDKIEHVTIHQLFFSMYTVLTQFGEMLFPFIIIYSISIDYKDKNILFYHALGITPLGYFLRKTASMAIWFSLAIFLTVLSISCIYGDFSLFFVSFVYYEGVILYIIVVASLLGFIFKSMVFAFGINLLIWVAGVIAHTVLPELRYLAYYDATNVLYLDYEAYLSTSDTNCLHIMETSIYNLIIFVIAVLTVTIFSDRWKKNGI